MTRPREASAKGAVGRRGRGPATPTGFIQRLEEGTWKVMRTGLTPWDLMLSTLDGTPEALMHHLRTLAERQGYDVYAEVQSLGTFDADLARRCGCSTRTIERARAALLAQGFIGYGRTGGRVVFYLPTADTARYHRELLHHMQRDRATREAAR
jgi:hypothetical protein